MPAYTVLTCSPVPAGCPAKRPEFNSACLAAEAGLSCQYGEQTCCGELYPEYVMQCAQPDLSWAGYYVDTVCMIGGFCCSDVVRCCTL